MTNYEAIISKGPLYLARLLTECKIRSIDAVCKKLGVPYEVSDKLLAEILIEHHENLLQECKEE